MTCGTQYSERISAYIDGELSGVELEELEAHIRGCPSCAALLDFYRLVSETESETRDARDVPEQLFKAVSERIPSLPVPSPAPVFTPGAPRARPLFTHAPERPRARRKINLRRLLPVACVIILLFALRLNTVTPDNMEPKYTSGDMTYERRPAASSSAEAPSAEAPVVEVPAEMPAADNATGDVYYSTESGESSSFSDGSGFAPMPSVPSDDEERAGGEVYIETAEVTDGDAPDGAVYAVIRIYGELPDMLLDKPEQALDGDSYSIEVTRDEAAKLTGELGFYAELTGVEADVALVIYTP